MYRLTVIRTVALLGILWLLYHLLPRDRDLSAPIKSALLPPEILIPKTVHQLLISMPGHPISHFKPNKHIISWQRSGWKIEYWSEDSCLQLGRELDGSDIYSETFDKLPNAVLKSDFCRYMIMLGRGGIYSDLDVQLLQPLPWGIMASSRRDHGRPPSVIIGMEGDASTIGLPRSPQFVQWTMASTPGHRIFRDLLDHIVRRTPEYLQQATTDDAVTDVMGWTGPSIWTDTVLGYLNCSAQQIEDLRDLKVAMRINEVLILPKRSFAVIQGEDVISSEVLVKHYFSGTWKSCKNQRLSWWAC
jgi:mannosyltransferase OCH1-like enzyme